MKQKPLQRLSHDVPVNIKSQKITVIHKESRRKEGKNFFAHVRPEQGHSMQSTLIQSAFEEEATLQMRARACPRGSVILLVALCLSAGYTLTKTQQCVRDLACVQYKRGYSVSMKIRHNNSEHYTEECTTHQPLSMSNSNNNNNNNRVWWRSSTLDTSSSSFSCSRPFVRGSRWPTLFLLSEASNLAPPNATLSLVEQASKLALSAKTLDGWMDGGTRTKNRQPIDFTLESERFHLFAVKESKRSSKCTVYLYMQVDLSRRFVPLNKGGGGQKKPLLFFHVVVIILVLNAMSEISVLWYDTLVRRPSKYEEAVPKNDSDAR